LFNLGFLRKKQEVFGLDIGSSAVKAVQLREDGGKYTLVALGRALLGPDVIADGTIKDPPAAVEAIKTAVGNAGIKTSETTIAISGRELIIKKVQIPEVPEKEVAGVVQLEAEHHIPFAIDEVFLDHHTVGQHDGVMDLVLVAVKKSKVNEYVGVVEAAGLAAVIVDVDAFALQNAYEVNYGAQPGQVVVLLNAGASAININILNGDQSVFTRDISIGGNAYTEALQKELSLSFDRADQLKRGLAVEALRRRILPVAAELLQIPADGLALGGRAVFALAEPARRLPLGEVARVCRVRGINVEAESFFSATNAGLGHTFCVALVDLAVDEETGKVTLLKTVSVLDSGRTINSGMLRGQMVGGEVQAIGLTLMEGMRTEGARLVTPTLMEYLVPTIMDIPAETVTSAFEAPDPTGPFGAKGAGEHTTKDVAPAIVHAIHDAVGVWIDELPASPERVWATLRVARRSASAAPTNG